MPDKSCCSNRYSKCKEKTFLNTCLACLQYMLGNFKGATGNAFEWPKTYRNLNLTPFFIWQILHMQHANLLTSQMFFCEFVVVPAKQKEMQMHQMVEI